MLTIELPHDLYERLRRRSIDAGKSVQTVAEELLTERLSALENNQPSTPMSERERARAALRHVGQLREPQRYWSEQERTEAVATYIREHPEEWAAMSERERAITVLRVAGLLAELTPEEKERAKHATMTLEEIHAAFARSSGKPLSEIVIEQRGPKV
jgi:hypothetical protein